MVETNYWSGYSYLEGYGAATGYGRVLFDGVYFSGWLVDSSAQYNKLIVGMPVPGPSPLPNEVDIVWWSAASGSVYRTRGTVTISGDSKVVNFTIPAGRISWVLQPEQ